MTKNEAEHKADNIRRRLNSGVIKDVFVVVSETDNGFSPDLRSITLSDGVLCEMNPKSYKGDHGYPIVDLQIRDDNARSMCTVAEVEYLFDAATKALSVINKDDSLDTAAAHTSLHDALILMKHKISGGEDEHPF